MSTPRNIAGFAKKAHERTVSAIKRIKEKAVSKTEKEVEKFFPKWKKWILLAADNGERSIEVSIPYDDKPSREAFFKHAYKLAKKAGLEISYLEPDAHGRTDPKIRISW